EDAGTAARAGATYLIAGGPHLNASGSGDLGAADEARPGHVARIVPPRDPAPENYHFGATCQLAALDADVRGAGVAAATLNRAGAILDVGGGTNAAGGGGAPGGHLYIGWDDNFPPLPWPAGFEVEIGAGAGSYTSLGGSAGNNAFGEELLGGLDWDVDG